jgi:hypothetical protein
MHTRYKTPDSPASRRQRIKPSAGSRTGKNRAVQFGAVNGRPRHAAGCETGIFVKPPDHLSAEGGAFVRFDPSTAW